MGKVLALGEAQLAILCPSRLEVRVLEELFLVLGHEDVPHLKYLLRRSIRHVFADGVLVDPVRARVLWLSLGELVEGLLNTRPLRQALMLRNCTIKILDKRLKLSLRGG